MTKKKNPNGGPRPNMTDEERAEEVQKMLRMRVYGASYQSIANQFGLSVRFVFERVQRELANMPKSEANDLRALEGLKLDNAEQLLEPALEKGDIKAINTVVRISESRRKLFGLDKPEQHEVKISREEETLIDQFVTAFTEQRNREAQEEEGNGHP